MYASDDTPAADVAAESPRKAGHIVVARARRGEMRDPCEREPQSFCKVLLYPVMRAIVIVCARAGGELERCDRLSVRA